MMKICAACTLELPKERFSNKQWQRKLPQRRCTECITIERVPQLTAPSCWICLGDEADKSERLRRDCSCRGTDAGFIHLSCLVEYAKKKNQEWDEAGCRDMVALQRPWRDCPNCHQRYENALSVVISNEFVSFILKEQPNNKQKQIEALRFRLSSLYESLKPTQLDAAKEVATRILGLIGQMKVETRPFLHIEYYMHIEATTYYALGVITCKMKTKEGGQEALAHFNKCLDLSMAINFVELTARAKCRISFMKSRYEGEEIKQHTEERLKICQDWHEHCVTTYGEEHAGNIGTGVNLAIALSNAHHNIEAAKLLTGMVSVSERVHGSQHETTKRAKWWLQKINARQAD
jgi:hypothetical protein